MAELRENDKFNAQLLASWGALTLSVLGVAFDGGGTWAFALPVNPTLKDAGCPEGCEVVL